MRKLFVYCLFLLVFLVSCHNGKTRTTNNDVVIAILDSIEQRADSLLLITEVYQINDELPIMADELFDDFIFEFSRLKKVQLERTQFPFLITNASDSTWISKEQWKHEPLFLNEDFYVVFFENEKDMELEKRTDLNEVNVECILLDSLQLLSYHFERNAGKWYLTKEHRQTLEKSPLGEFLVFYNRFASDDAFQNRSIAKPLHYITTDVENGNELVKGTLDNEQWQMFKPQLPIGMLTSIHYGQTFNKPRKITMVKRGIANGLMEILTFKKSRGKWKLTSFEN